jgi:hypothetical protein
MLENCVHVQAKLRAVELNVVEIHFIHFRFAEKFPAEAKQK